MLFSNYKLIVLLLFSVFFSSIYFKTLDKTTIKYGWVYKGLSILFLIIFCMFAFNLSMIKWILISLGFSLLGDIFLGYNEEKYFIHGLGAFLCAHLCSSLFFLTHFNRISLENIVILSSLSCIFFIACGFYKYLYSSLKNFRVPVGIYIFAITTMSFTAMLSIYSSILLLSGVLLFILSDSLLAIQKFKSNFRLANQFIWVSYYLAQIAIIFSIYFSENKNL